MEIKTRQVRGSFIELKADQQETNCFSKEEAVDAMNHLLDVVDELKWFIEDKFN